jgi:hypothetical protein
MKKINLADATDSQIVWLVAKCEGYDEGYLERQLGNPNPDTRAIPGYCTDPSEAWPIIEREKISILWRPERGVYWACCGGQDPADEEVTGQNGATALAAAMRCYVAHELGDEDDGAVEVPDVL